MNQINDRDRQVMRQALAERDENRLNSLMVALAFSRVSEADVERELYAAVAEQDEETQHWWQGPCNCHGGLN